MFNFQCDKQGLTSVFDVPPIDKSKLKEIPANAIAGFAFRCSLEKVMQLVKGSVPEADMEEAMARFNIETGLDLESDIVEHLDGTVRYYNAGSVIAPKQIGILKIKDEAKFEKSLKQINERVEEMAAEQGFEFTESEKKGLRVYGIKNPPASFYWAVKDGELYISSSARTIGSHIRKAAKGEQATLLDSELASKILSQADTLGLKGPIAMNHYDFDPVFEAAVPAIAGLYAFLPPETTEAFDFTPEDLPPVEALLGMRPTKSMIFQASNGYTGIFRYDAPAPLELSTVAVSGVAIGMLLPAVQAVREAARRTQSMNNQRQLVLALLNYEAAHGRFPPAYTTDADGKPLLSWRVAILPYLDENDLFEEFHQDEPWDSEHNIALLEKMPPFFKNPSSLGDRLGYTDYVAPVNKDSVLASGKGIRIAQITDGTSNTVMLMEVGGDQQVPWSSPQDIKVEDLKTLQLPNGHPGTVTVAFVDGSVHSISKLVPVEDFWKS